MPDLFLVLQRRWSLILLLTLAGTAAAYIACLLSPKLYIGTTTALPVNTLVNDKARLFNQNIEALYSEIGTADELDKLEGTAQLDTLFLAVADAHHLAMHYDLDTTAGDALEKAALLLRRRSDITKTGYGELNIKVWDKNNEMAAALANALMQTINAIHERLQTENNRMILQKLKEAYAAKLQAQTIAERKAIEYTGAASLLSDTVIKQQLSWKDFNRQQNNIAGELEQYGKLIGEYEMGLKTTPKVLLVVEQARSSPWHDRPKTAQIVLLAFFASLLFSILLAVFVESRKPCT